MKIASNPYFKQVLTGILAGVIMAAAGFIWVGFAARFIFSTMSPAVVAVLSFGNMAVYVIETVIILILVCWLPFYFKANRLIKAVVFYLIFPLLWIMAICAVLYGKVLPQDILSAINNRSTMEIPIYGGATAIPVIAVLYYYFKHFREKLTEAVTLSCIFTAMNLSFYTFLNALILACVYFGECA